MISSSITSWAGNINLTLHDINLPNINYGDSLARPLTEYRQKDRVDVILANPQTYRTKKSADLFLILMIHLLKDSGRAAIVLSGRNTAREP